MTIIEQIKAEIERLYNGEAPKHDQQCNFDDGYFVGIDAIAQFLDSLESEKPMSLEEEIKKEMVKLPFFIRGKDQIAFARHFAEWGAEWQKEQSLMESHKAWMDHKSSMIKQIEKAKWQGYDKGLADGTVLGKEQMMEEAVEGYITNAGGETGYDVAAFRFDENHTYTVLLPHEEGRKHGDKVRVIVLPKED